MVNKAAVDVLVRVKSIRFTNDDLAIFKGQIIKENGEPLERTDPMVIKGKADAFEHRAIEKGQWWRIIGSASSRITRYNGFSIEEKQIEADAAQYIKPSGRFIIEYLADSRQFVGIGQVKARRLWEQFGEGIYRILDSGDPEPLKGVLKPGVAQTLLDAWRDQNLAQTLKWITDAGIPYPIAKKAMNFYGEQLKDVVEDNPYRLLSFSGDWRLIDQYALSYQLSEDDPRRLRAAVEEALQRVFSIGHTLAHRDDLIEPLQILLGAERKALATEALRCSSDSFITSSESECYHPLGAWIMEKTIAEFIREKITVKTQGRLFDDLDFIFKHLEKELEIILNQQQKQAVEAAAGHHFSLVTGGAGTGKTTLLRALHILFQTCGIKTYQAALSGRAAKRMQESTGVEAMTLAGFLKNMSAKDYHKAAFIIDEASMVDVVTFYQVIRKLPESCRLILVGDTAQLPPIGPGLVLHELVKQTNIPHTELVTVSRFKGDILEAATQIRHGQWSLSSSPEFQIIECSKQALNGKVGELFQTYSGDTQILCASRVAKSGGAKTLNELCQKLINPAGKKLMVFDPYSERYVYTGMSLNDRIICTRNNWDMDLQNGSLGTLVKVEAQPLPVSASGTLIDDPVCEDEMVLNAIAWVSWDDGRILPITETNWQDYELAYAITIHKAQGSQFDNVIVPVQASPYLDRSLIYTAVTRAKKKVIILGDIEACKTSVYSIPNAETRLVSLGKIINSLN